MKICGTFGSHQAIPLWWGLDPLIHGLNGAWGSVTFVYSWCTIAAGSDGKELGNTAVRANDGVRSSYLKFLTIKGLDETNASLFFQYVRESEVK